MRHFITTDGIVSVEMSDMELFKRLCGDQCRMNSGVLGYFSHLLEQHYVLFKAFDYPFDDLFKWVHSEKSASNKPDLFNLAFHLELARKSNHYPIICSIDSSSQLYFTETLYVEKYKVESLLRKKIIDDFLADNP